MATIISSTNNKWWVWKTSTIVNVSQILSTLNNKKVLVVDLDQQCNLSQAILGKNEFQVNLNAWELFDVNSDVDINNLIIKKTKNLHIIPWKVDDLFLIDAILQETHKSIWKIEELTDWMSSENYEQNKKHIKDIINKMVWDKDEYIKILKKRLSVIENDYDYIFLDLPPSVTRVPENAWVSSDFLLVPISDNFALNWTEWLINKMIDIKKNYNDNLQFIFFFNKVPLSSNYFWKNHVNKEYLKLITNFTDAISENDILSEISYVMEDVIRESRDLEKSYWQQRSLLEFKDSKVLEDYKWFSKSLIKICE